MKKREPTSQVTNEDCMQLMSRYPDKYFELAIVDPPYGINEAAGKNATRNKGFIKPNSKSKKICLAKDYGNKSWDKKPANIEFFTELFRVSKNQIIWGANHFISRIPYDSSAWIVWDKDNGDSDFADCELAWTSFKKAVRMYKYRWNGLLQQDMKNKEFRIHPTQKPVGLYKWLLKNYASEGDKILDTHLGSGSSRIAADKMGFDFYACELDRDYFEAQEKRFKEYKSQLILF
jgi:site-specific DNA-methyltransferase (adenine-specific)